VIVTGPSGFVCAVLRVQVQTYHISTMTVAQRSALANSWLTDTSGGANPSGSPNQADDQQEQQDDNSSDDNNSHGSIEAQQKNLLVGPLPRADPIATHCIETCSSINTPNAAPALRAVVGLFNRLEGSSPASNKLRLG
jgi:hypothetical protein